MNPHLFFVTTEKEAEETFRRITILAKSDQWIVVGNNPIANRRLENYHIPFYDSGVFFPRGKMLRRHQIRLARYSKIWAKEAGINKSLRYGSYQLDEIVSYSLNLHLSEIEHSLLTAKNIIDRFQPKTIHVSARWTELPYRLYQSEMLNLENLALYFLGRSQRIPVRKFIDIQSSFRSWRNTFLVAIRPILGFGRGCFKRLSLMKKKFPGLAPLVIFAHYYHLTSLIPFLQSCQKYKINFTLVGKTSPEQKADAKKRQIPFLPLEQLLEQTAKSPVVSLIHIMKFWRLWTRSESRLRRVFSSFHPLYWLLVREKLKHLFLVEFPRIIGHLDLGYALFSQPEVKVMLTMASADVLSRSYTGTAAANGKTVIELQHGFLVFDEEHPFRFHHIHAIWGPALKKLMKKAPFPPSKLKVTGFPLFDDYQKSFAQLEMKRRGRLLIGVKPPDRVILILAVFPIAADRLLSGTSPYQFLTLIDKALRQTKKPWTIIFRPHPSADAQWVKNFPFSPLVKLIYDPRQFPQDQIIAASDIVIGNFTTALIHAVAMRKPILLYPFSDPAAVKLMSHPIVTTKAVSPFRSQAQLVSLLASVFSDQKYRSAMRFGQQQFLKEYCGFSRTSATDRLVELLKQDNQPF